MLLPLLYFELIEGGHAVHHERCPVTFRDAQSQVGGVHIPPGIESGPSGGFAHEIYD